jgi:hypothetical protein
MDRESEFGLRPWCPALFTGPLHFWPKRLLRLSQLLDLSIGDIFLPKEGKRSMVGKLALLFLGWGVAVAQPLTTSARAGTVRLLQGSASIDGKPVEMRPSPSPQMRMNNGQRIHVDWGRMELQLGPDVALTMTEGSTLHMQENRLSDVRVELEEGSALVTVDQLYKGDRLRVMYSGGAAELRSCGWYRFDAKPKRLRVYRGSAAVAAEDSVIKAKKGQAVDLSGGLGRSPFNLKDPDPLIVWELQLADDRRPLARLTLPAPWR